MKLIKNHLLTKKHCFNLTQLLFLADRDIVYCLFFELFTVDSMIVMSRWLAVIREMELMHLLHHQRQHTIEPVSSRCVWFCSA